MRPVLACHLLLELLLLVRYAITACCLDISDVNYCDCVAQCLYVELITGRSVGGFTSVLGGSRETESPLNEVSCRVAACPCHDRLMLTANLLCCL